jgi:ubiquitin carboxyl-terminal hydrolase 20/33
MLSSGKIGSYVSFPLDDLDMKSFIHSTKKSKRSNRIAEYELCSIICHYGSSNGGHYIAYARNYLNEEWYEYDDSYCKRVDLLTVQNTQAYVLFYR